LSVLVVDDHPANRLLMSQQLEYLGHHHHLSHDGEQGLKAWLDGDFDLVIADCNMPIMSGYELARAIRLRETEHQLPPCTILGFTANAQPEERQRCKDAGMNDCLFKPISLSALNQWMNQIKPAKRPCACLHALTGGNPVSTRRLLAELLSSNRSDRQELLDAAENGDRRALAETAHKIKGVARIVQATSLVQLCEALELACHQAPERIEGHAQALEQAMTELEQALQTEIIKAE
jgi:two-component system sensor histidine kinase EvgS